MLDCAVMLPELSITSISLTRPHHRSFAFVSNLYTCYASDVFLPECSTSSLLRNSLPRKSSHTNARGRYECSHQNLTMPSPRTQLALNLNKAVLSHDT
ncbi:hypothetical protein E2C01_037826 [Portunus trituberculatus]|uniref:Uncharacterized protein n=1 Tax=Portunus trituberculatus TaxID=210409 RepID=A0A5B7FCI0_PORTR|nr:hypothetical protein [Portunus trituberculatus]